MAVTSEMDDVTAQDALKNLSAWLEHYYGKKAIILLDEYEDSYAGSLCAWLLGAIHCVHPQSV